MDQHAIAAIVNAIKPRPELEDLPGLQKFAIIPQGMSIQSLEDYELEPHRVEQKVTLLTADDFVRYWLRFKHDASVIFGDERSATYTAIIDYHGTDATPHWCSHTAIYACPNSPEWTIWSGSDGKKMSQAEFAEFIENNYPDITKPAHADMLQVSTNLQAKKSVDFSQSTRLDNGQSQLTYQEKVTGSVETKAGSMKVPDEFELVLPVFLGGPPYKVTARLRYRIGEGRLAIWYDLHRPQKVVQAATQKVTEAIRKGIGSDPMFLGAA